MKKNIYNVVGLMSGTSLDGVDIVYCRLALTSEWGYEVIYGKTYAYPDLWKDILLGAIHKTSNEVDEIDERYTKYLGELIQKFKKEYSITEVDLVCSHGHTIFHDPANGYTKQIGNKSELAKIVGETVMCDFRVQDVELGGQGAPLVPIGDRLLFGSYYYCLNLGGFANISFEEKGERIAYDICPVNIVLNHYTRKIGLEYDAAGYLASSGTVSDVLLTQLNSLNFYRQSYPKSLGLEWVQKEVLPMIDDLNLTIPDILKTFVIHVAEQIAKVVQPDKSLLATGGGVYNTFLMNAIKQSSKVKVEAADAKLIEYKEALIFGLLGVLKHRDEVNCLSSVTGARRDHSSGVLYNP
ncbi:anhydro-N-acetylmuramic acid kinase [Neptunitalea chrysea]|uniref:Anhydro-N-acetylmuramic acid kinase n=1 Tax=Neptunitalea chrysea TaxID=1647581 RepID=A0A9W6B557_9FLAO|nr:anhydro-N-acetylmuramic acid kinase [Neptunitalea chrysea]GLB52833.1 anhydro-N-acetylmuramic acid kinase [Neptunitalea chrysea]